MNKVTCISYGLTFNDENFLHKKHLIGNYSNVQYCKKYLDAVKKRNKRVYRGEKEPRMPNIISTMSY